VHIVVYGGCVPRKSLGAGAVGGRARVVARERRVILLLFVASVAFGRCERCDDVTCLLVVTRTKFVIVTFFYTVSAGERDQGRTGPHGRRPNVASTTTQQSYMPVTLRSRIRGNCKATAALEYVTVANPSGTLSWNCSDQT
jgi:hypothetical protein